MPRYVSRERKPPNCPTSKQSTNLEWRLLESLGQAQKSEK